jgi:DNA-binding SARP family transcriptional activator
LEEAVGLGGQGFHASILANTLSNLGEVAFFKSDYALAEARYRRSIELKAALNDASGLAHTWTRMSELRRLQRNLDEALAYAQRALEIGAGAAGPNQQLPAETALALCWLAQGKSEEASDLLDTIVTSHRNVTENKYELTRCLWGLAHARHALGQAYHAPLAEALALAEQWGYAFLITRLAQEYAGPLVAAVAADLLPAFTSSILLRLGDAIVPGVAGLLESSDPVVRQRAVGRLAALGGDNAWEPLSRAALDSNPAVKTAAEEALARLAQSPPAPLLVTTLGHFSLKRGREIIPYKAWGSRQAQSLFHYLLAHAGQAVHRQDLINLLWPELAADDRATAEQAAKAQRTLNELISRLRHVLEPYLPRTRNYLSRYLFSEGDTYRLELPDGSWVDATAFEAAVQQARQARRQGNREAAAAHYQAAVDLYQGHFLVEERYEDWCLARRETLGLLAVEALETLAAWHVEGREYDHAVTTAVRQLELEPLHERGYLLLMRAQYALGQLPAALRTYERYLREYCAELGAPPNPDISALHDQIRDQIQKKR